MGSGYSQADYDGFGWEFYMTALSNRCLLPDIGIDESLLKYSAPDSNALLQQTSNQLISSVPDYIEKLGSGLGQLTRIPNAVGLGALVISLIIDLIIKSGNPAPDQTYSMLQRVFGEEKGSAVRDTMTEYLKRHRMYMNNEEQLKREIGRVEQQLSSQLSRLRNSLLYDGQMSTRGFKIWANGASFHVQMLIHEARLNVQAGKRASDYVNQIYSITTSYLQDLNQLLEKFKTHTGSIKMDRWVSCGRECSSGCIIRSETCGRSHSGNRRNPCRGPEVAKAFMHLFVTHNPLIATMRGHFTDIRSNLDTLIKQKGSFIVR